MAIDEAEQLQQKQTWRIITRRPHIRVAVSHQRADKGKIDQRGDHAAQAAFNIAIFKDFDEALFKAVMGKQGKVWERPLMGEQNIGIDLVELFGYTGDGELIKAVHHVPFDPGGSCSFRSDYPKSFFLKLFPSGYTNTSLMLPWTM